MLRLILCFFVIIPVWCETNYSGYRVLTIIPKTNEELEILYHLKNDYSVDLWNEPQDPGVSIMAHLKPTLSKTVEESLTRNGIQYEVTYQNLESLIDSERSMRAPGKIGGSQGFDFGKYNKYDDIVTLIKDLADNYTDFVKLEVLGKTFENRPIYALKIGSEVNKPAIMMECGVHAREWTSVAACTYFVNRLIKTYNSDPEVKSLLDKYEFNVVVESNPDGYVYTWTQDRLWRKTRSRSSIDWTGVCRGADANRNFDVDHCGAGTSRKPCEEDFCGDKPFSESEARALRDLMIDLGDRLKAFFSIHAFSQYWLTPYGISNKFPSNYERLEKIASAGMDALAKKYGTEYEFGTISNVIYPAAGSSVDYAYVHRNVSVSFALELRDRGRFGFFLPQKLILPTCEETFDGLVAAVNAI